MSGAHPPVVVFCLEELSAKVFLESFLPRLFPEIRNLVTKFIVFSGKRDLDTKLERRLREWLRPNTTFIVLRDQDSGDCVEIKNQLLEKARRSGRSAVLVRIACRELESWYLGDLTAVEAAMGTARLARHQANRKYSKPDALNNPAQELDRLTLCRSAKFPRVCSA